MSLLLTIWTIVWVSLGGVFFLAGTVGLIRFPDSLTRLHALTKADNLGLGLVVIGLLPQTDSVMTALKLLFVWLLVLISSACVGQLIGQHIRKQVDTPP
jgi:multicomponent Na+:H+ antiporter subunit G